MNDEDRIQSYDKFWLFYLMEHSHPTNRALHFVGTTLGFFSLATFFLTLDWRLILFGLVSGYSFAWFGHFVVQKNRPATFKYPYWSFISDWKMWYLTLAGKLHQELERAQKARF